MRHRESTLILVLVFVHVSGGPRRDEPQSSRPRPTGLFDNMKMSTNFWSSRSLISTAKDYASEGDFETAIAFVNKALVKKPYKVGHYVLRAEYNMKLKRYRRAFEDLQEGYNSMNNQLGLFSGNPRIDYIFTAPKLAKHGDHFMQLGEFDFAEWFYTKAIEMDKEQDSSYFVKKGKCNLALKNTYEAIIDLEEALRQRSPNPELLPLLEEAYSEVMQYMDILSSEKILHLANRFMERKAFNHAISCYDELIIRRSAVPNYYKLRATCYQLMGNLDLAIDDYAKYLRKDSEDPVAWINFIELCTTARKLDLALNELRALDESKLAPIALQHEDRCEIAIPLYTELIKRDSSNAQYFWARGHCHATMNDSKAAILDYEVATELESSDMRSRHDVIKFFHVLYEEGRYDDAIREIKILDDPRTLQGFCDRFKREKKLEGAIKCYSLMIEKYPNKSTWFKSRGECYQKLKMYEEAVNDIMQAIEFEPKNGDLRNRLEELFHEQEQAVPIPNPEPVLDMVVFDPDEPTPRNETEEVTKKLNPNRYLEDLMSLSTSALPITNTAEEFPKTESKASNLISFTTSYPAPGPAHNGASTQGWELALADPFDTAGSQTLGNDFHGTRGMALVPVNPFDEVQTTFGNENIGMNVSTNPFLAEERPVENIPGNETANVAKAPYQNPFD